MTKQKKITDVIYIITLFIIWFSVSIISLLSYSFGEFENAFTLTFPVLTFFFILFIIEKYDLGRKLDTLIKNKLNIYD